MSATKVRNSATTSKLSLRASSSNIESKQPKSKEGSTLRLESSSNVSGPSIPTIALQVGENQSVNEANAAVVSSSTFGLNAVPFNGYKRTNDSKRGSTEYNDPKLLGEEVLDFSQDDHVNCDPILFSPPPEAGDGYPDEADHHWTLVDFNGKSRNKAPDQRPEFSIAASVQNIADESCESWPELNSEIEPSSPSEREERAQLEKIKLEELERIAQNQKLEDEERQRLAEEELSIKERNQRDELIIKIKTLLQEKESLQARNATVQNNLAEFLEKKRGNEGDAGLASGVLNNAESDKTGVKFKLRYGFLLETLCELGQQLQEQNDNDSRIKLQYQEELAKKNQQYEEKKKELATLRRKASLASVNSKTGVPLTESNYQALVQADEKKSASVHLMRLENIKLRNLLKCQEDALSQKEELAGGVHLIDFEQLKIENQTYNEKIEERNEESVKLRKTINKVVHILTHVKEKLAFEQSENAEARNQLKSLDAQVTKQRDHLPVLKHERDILRNTTSNLKRKHGLLGHKNLLRDYESKSEECELLEKQCSQMRAKHADISAELLALKRKVQKVQAYKNLASAL